MKKVVGCWYLNLFKSADGDRVVVNLANDWFTSSPILHLTLSIKQLKFVTFYTLIRKCCFRECAVGICQLLLQLSQSMGSTHGIWTKISVIENTFECTWWNGQISALNTKAVKKKNHYLIWILHCVGCALLGQAIHQFPLGNSCRCLLEYTLLLYPFGKFCHYDCFIFTLFKAKW